MIKSSLKEIRSMKRNQTMLAQLKDVQLDSVKSSTKIRSSQQINLNSLIENKNEKIKNIDTKLEIHQSEIQKNNHVIEELNNNFYNLKTHLDREKQLTQIEERKNKLLREEIERTNKLLKNKHAKLEEYIKKIAEMDKDSEQSKIQIAKNQEYIKTITILRAKNAQIEESVNEARQTVVEKEKEIIKLKEKLTSVENSKQAEEQFLKEIALKEGVINEMKGNIKILAMQQSRENEIRLQKKAKIDQLSAEMETLIQVKESLQKSVRSYQIKNAAFEERISILEKEKKEISFQHKDHEALHAKLKADLQEITAKYNNASDSINEKQKQIALRDEKIEKLLQKVKKIEAASATYAKENQKFHSFETKMEQLKKKSSLLETLYNTMTPQIQCPYGHQLNNPVTIIPCGHNFCLGCKKGYAKECMQCHGKLKIEAVYRNELMDDIIDMVGGVKQVIELLK